MLAASIPTWGTVSLHEDPASIVGPLSSKLLAPEQVQLVQQALERHFAIGDSIMQFGLGILDMDRFEQFGLVLAMARRLRIPVLLRITLDQLLDWAVAVDSLYLPNPYHSFAHAVDVTFMCFFTFVNLHAADLVTDLEQTAVFFAALCHDLGHPGKNNTFMINTKHSLAARYHNQSVLENYSVDLGRDLMLQHGLLAHMSGATRDVFIDMFTDLILGTDMSKHFALVKDLGELSRQLLHADHLVTLAEEEQQVSAGSLSGDGRPEITIAPAATQRDPPVMLSQSVAKALDRMVRASPAPSMSAGPSISASGTETTHTAPLVPTMPLSASVTFPEPTARRMSSSKSATFSSQNQDDAQAALSPRHKLGFTVASTNVLSPSIQLPWAPLVQSAYDAPNSSSDDHTHAVSSKVDLSGPATGAQSDALATVQLLTAPQRRNLVKCLLHAADISNTVRPWDLCKRWSDLVEKEHFAQGDAELALGLALSSPNMDRRNCQQAKVSMDFSDVIIHPFFVLLADVLPGTELYLDQLAVNRASWEQIRERDKMQRASWRRGRLQQSTRMPLGMRQRPRRRISPWWQVRCTDLRVLHYRQQLGSGHRYPPRARRARMHGDGFHG
ncbi:hypothetical protein BCR44DRAFT_1017877 [Catenaria anguillulae PL171]|uniref:Phosphodiesterase n=1 Tax=Catenaria anguillulae PL171 TaxID=765915 RepID=A0A1Y2H8U4_9FUNG|nr:hypothetical protein BCR44DRAFT_1017877 [Catenaria anguillulae PL171]